MAAGMVVQLDVPARLQQHLAELGNASKEGARIGTALAGVEGAVHADSRLDYRSAQGQAGERDQIALPPKMPARGAISAVVYAAFRI